MNTGRSVVALLTLALAAVLVQTVEGRAVPLRIPLHEMPFQLGSWTGRAEPADPALLERARPDEVLSRQYADVRGRVVRLYVGSYRRQASRGQVLAACHGNCEIAAAHLRRIDVPGGPITVNAAQIRQDGVLLLALWWYQQADLTTYAPHRGKIEQVKRAFLKRRSDGAVVRVTAPVSTTTDEAAQRATAFVEILFPLLRQHFPE